jgi:DNA helicase HerA-like ATPase
LGREPDPAKSREHVLLSVLAERRLAAGQSAELGALMQDVLEPPIEQIGALSVNAFMKKNERRNLAAALNNLLASPSLAGWRQGVDLDVAEWLKPKHGKTPIVVVSVAHLDDEERALVLGVLLEEVLSWVRTLSGSERLRALLVFDEVYGFLPPHPANPPTKRPLVALMKQARGFGVGVVVATQNPMDLDYRALSNAGFGCIGRLQTDADRARVLDGLAAARGVDGVGTELATTLQRLAPRWFLVRNARVKSAPILMNPRHAMTFMRGPMTRTEIRRARLL